MKIDLKYPFNDIYDSGYIVVNSEGRRTVILYKSPNGKGNGRQYRTSMSYARYLMCCHKGRILKPDEHVDHIDGDKTNDRIDNLQILSCMENNRKTHLRVVELICPVCNKTFKRNRSQLRGRLHKIKTGEITCSRKCGGKFSHITKRMGNRVGSR